MKLDMLKGQLELVVLASLARGPLHGYAIIKGVRERSDGELELLEGTLYPALHRLEQAALVKSSWSTEGGRRRRVYELTTKGRSALAEQDADWRRFVRTLDSLLATAQ
jgi:PadR family transcriptional regulator, regulatory protein PadR